MTKIDIFSGFLGAGKTTLIKKLLKEAMDASKVVLIENEFGEIGIDGGFLKEAGVQMKEMNSGCICCSLVGDFGTSLAEVMTTYKPERILIEPSGVGKLSDVMKAVQGVESDVEVALNSAVAVVDANKCKMYSKNFGEFFLNQIEHAGTVILSRTADISPEKLEAAIAIVKEHNPKASVITTPWDELDGKQILATIENQKSLEEELMEEVKHHHEEHDDDCDCGCHDHEHHHHDHDDDCECGCHDYDHEHHHDHDEDEHEHHHHDHDDDCECGCHDHDHEHHHDHDEDDHEHHHDHDENCTCGCHDHDHEHHHHHADEVFTSWGFETADKYSADEIQSILEALEDEKKYGFVLRAKGMVDGGNGSWVHFDYVPGEPEVRKGGADVTGKICVIGSKLQEDNLKTLFAK